MHSGAANWDVHQGLSAVVCGLLLGKLNKKSKDTVRCTDTDTQTQKHTNMTFTQGNAPPAQNRKHVWLCTE